MEALRWLGLDWDEGPDVGGPCGPYRQSERGEIYREHVQQLLDNGHAFRCFLTPEDLQELRSAHQAAGGIGAFDSPHAHLTEDEEQAYLDKGAPYVIRLRVPREGDCVFTDKLRGEISIPWQQVDMQILLKSDGILVIEDDIRAELKLNDNFKLIEKKNYGKTQLIFLIPN